MKTGAGAGYCWTTDGPGHKLIIQPPAASRQSSTKVWNGTEKRLNVPQNILKLTSLEKLITCRDETWCGLNIISTDCCKNMFFKVLNVFMQRHKTFSSQIVICAVQQGGGMMIDCPEKVSNTATWCLHFRMHNIKKVICYSLYLLSLILDFIQQILCCIMSFSSWEICIRLMHKWCKLGTRLILHCLHKGRLQCMNAISLLLLLKQAPAAHLPDYDSYLLLY